MDNEYFRNILRPAEGLLLLPSDKALGEDEETRPWVELYASDLARFHADYARAHAKLSELGTTWDDA
jgi:hypothetical protein